MPNRQHGPLNISVTVLDNDTIYRWHPHTQRWAAYPVTVELADPPAPPALVWEGDYA